VQVTRPGRRVAELAPQPTQVHVDGPAGARLGLVPYRQGQFAARHHLTGAGGENTQHVEFAARQVERGAVEPRQAPLPVEPHAADREDAIVAVRPIRQRQRHPRA
jgi:hypothetical protein